MATTDDFEAAQAAVFERYGLTVERRFVDVAAIHGRAHVSVCGDGPPVLLVIGGGAPGALWAPLMAKLEGFTLYAVDRPGFGLTDPVRHAPTLLRGQAVGFLQGVLEGLELGRVAVVANSMGGLWASWLSLDQPDLVAAVVQIGCPAIVLDTSAPIAMRLLAVRVLGNAMMRLEPPGPGQALRLMARLGDPVDQAPEVRALMVACQRQPAYRPAWLALLHAALRVRGARPEVALGADELRRIRQPVQLIWGEHDPFGPPDVGEKVGELLPDAEFHLTGGGHIPWISQASWIGDLVRPFLTAHVDRGSARPGSETLIEGDTPGG